MSFVLIEFILLPKMRFTHNLCAFLLCALTLNVQVSVSQLSQNTINIARGKTITASATCGYDLPPGQDEELFCKLATVPGKYGIDGLECGECNPKVTSGSIQEIKDHRIEYAIDGTEKWWQSPPLSRGLQYNEINITIDLGQVRILHINTLFIQDRINLRDLTICTSLPNPSYSRRKRKHAFCIVHT